MFAKLAVLLIRLLAQLTNFLWIVEKVGEALLLVFVRLAGPLPWFVGFEERARKFLLLPRRRNGGLTSPISTEPDNGLRSGSTMLARSLRASSQAWRCGNKVQRMQF